MVPWHLSSVGGPCWTQNVAPDFETVLHCLCGWITNIFWKRLSLFFVSVVLKIHKSQASEANKKLWIEIKSHEVCKLNVHC